MLRLNNGATTLMHFYDGFTKENVILAEWGSEFVTWLCGNDGECYWGNYFNSLEDAKINFMKRVSNMESFYHQMRTNDPLIYLDGKRVKDSLVKL
jgi:hypothetical protein